MIPHVIHYCWFGQNELSPKAKKCIRSWTELCPSFEIKEWNEDNFDVYANSYTARTYQNKQYAFLSDYVRLKVVEQFGGIYLDTDVELVKSLETLCGNEAYFGFETDEFVNTGLGFGAEAHHPAVQQMLKEYEALEEDDRKVVGCPVLNTQALVKLGLQKNGKYQMIAGAAIYPIDTFNPYDDPTGKLNLTDRTVSIHWYAKTWMNKGKAFRSRLTKPLHRLQRKLRKGK